MTAFRSMKLVRLESTFSDDRLRATFEIHEWWRTEDDDETRRRVVAMPSTLGAFSTPVGGTGDRIELDLLRSQLDDLKVGLHYNPVFVLVDVAQPGGGE